MYSVIKKNNRFTFKNKFSGLVKDYLKKKLQRQI